MLKGEVNVESMCFFPKTLSAKKLLSLFRLLPVDLLYGFQFLKTFIMKNPLRVSPCNSWRLDYKMRTIGVFYVNPTENLDPKFLFKIYFVISAIREYASKRVEKAR